MIGYTLINSNMAINQNLDPKPWVIGIVTALFIPVLLYEILFSTRNRGFLYNLPEDWPWVVWLLAHQLEALTITFVTLLITVGIILVQRNKIK